MNSDDFKDQENVPSQTEDGNDIMDSSEPSDNRSGYQKETARPILQSDPGNLPGQGNPEADTYEKGRIEPENHIYAGLYAGFWTRFWAYLLDLIVIGSVNRMIINPVFRALDLSLIEDGIFSPMAIATAVVFYLYFVLMTKFFGQTLGKMVFGLKVVELDGKGLTWGTVIFREWVGRFISATIMILYVVVAFTKKKQGLHDLFADTTVIYEPR
ncbi:RDD family protein [Bacillus sp. ISL-45]|nr:MULTISPECIES: RDD family protein [unclassified Bacillus (in: firmicutes)]MBT2638470.1 RDD family protein [Bacillus sp. ISL-39]MBT2662164.1 RDD family protein [Bacillus sp. ISL-45]